MSLASDAPLNDLLLFHRIDQYRAINKTVSDAVMKKLRNHLWYLGPEMVPLALSSSKISIDEKLLMAKAMAGSGGDWTVRGIRYPAAQCSQASYMS